MKKTTESLSKSENSSSTFRFTSYSTPKGNSQATTGSNIRKVTRSGDVVPKAISVRSRMSDYVAMKKNKDGSVVNDSDCLKVTGASTESKLPHRVHLPAKDGEVEVEVYKQGTTKTELCNKWEETGECQYGELCQFAHGVDELCPVIRHPRYKTEVCRMITSGDPCPYSHRCHFCHSLHPSQEKVVVL